MRPTEYVGEFYNDLMHGIGTRRFQSGDVYNGPYYMGRMDTSQVDALEGRFYYANGDLYSGQWLEGMQHGTGKYYFNTGASYCGTFECGKRQGKGRYLHPDGVVDILFYINDVCAKDGVRISKNKKKAWKLKDGKTCGSVMNMGEAHQSIMKIELQRI